MNAGIGVATSSNLHFIMVPTPNKETFMKISTKKYVYCAVLLILCCFYAVLYKKLYLNLNSESVTCEFLFFLSFSSVGVGKEIS